MFNALNYVFLVYSLFYICSFYCFTTKKFNWLYSPCTSMAHIMNFHLNDVYDFQYRGRMVRRQLMGKNS